MSNYTLSAFRGVLSHASASAKYIEDADEQFNTQDLKAHVKSGDYFSLLATKLDEISQAINDCGPEQTIVLQQLIDNLLYLQKYYHIVPK